MNTPTITDDRLRNTRAWAASRIGELSGAEVIVAACDEALAARSVQRPSNSLLTLLEECESFVDRHSESWYRSGQELLAQIREAKTRLSHEPPAEPVCEWCGGTKDQHDDPSTFRPRAAQPPAADDLAFLLFHVLDELSMYEDFTRNEVADHLRAELKRRGIERPTATKGEGQT